MMGNMQGRWQSSSTLLLQIQLDNISISVNNQENYPKTGRINSTTKCREETTWKRAERVETGSETKQNYGTVHRRDDITGKARGRNRHPHQRGHMGKTVPHNISLFTKEGLNFRSSYNQQGFKYRNF